jgi:hypothetical protein
MEMAIANDEDSDENDDEMKLMASLALYYYGECFVV